MGGADVYCAICGGPFNRPYWDEGDTAEYNYDSAIIDNDSSELDWLGDVRIIGENPESTGLSRVWISGPAAHDDHGNFELEPDDPVAEELGDENVTTYTYEGSSFAVPYHQTCWTLLSTYLKVGSDGIDKEIVFQVLRQLAHTAECGEEYAQALKMDYGSVSESQEQYWCVKRGDEHHVHSPLVIGQLEDYTPKLPRLELDLPMKDAPQGNYGAASDPISTLPVEIRWSILACADITSVARLFQASRTLYDSKPSNSWWKLKLLTDMPWLFEISAVEDDEEVDWARVYKDLWLASRYQPSAHRMPGLANRRRIWEELLPQIGDPYEKLKWELDQVEIPDMLKGARSTGLQRLVSPEPKDNASSRFFFAQSLAGLKDAHIEFHVHLDEERYIRGIHLVGRKQEPGESLVADSAFNFPTSVEVVSIPEDDCLTGIVVTSRELSKGKKCPRKIVGLDFLLGNSAPQQIGSNEGDKRLIHVSEDHFAVGIQTFSSQEGGISRISLIQQPLILAQGIDRFVPRSTPSNNLTPNAIKFLWRDQLPPPGLQVSDYETGYWTYDMQEDVSPMEALIFGTSEEELADITSISVDVQYGGFEVRYGHRESRSVGPRHHAMKTLAIDGQGGERMVTLHYVVEYLPLGIRIVTNRGRQLIVGRVDRTEVQHPPRIPETDQLTCLAGIYGWWSSRDKPDFRLEAAGCLFATELEKGDQKAIDVPDLAAGPQGAQWEPSTPPSSLREIGPIFGEFSLQESEDSKLEILKRCRIVSWIDCSRPLSQVRVTTCHSTGENQAPLAAIAFKYADGANEEISIGPGLSPQHPTDTEGEDGNPWCWCSYSGQKVEEELKAHPHYRHATWKLDGKRLQSVRLFLSPVDETNGTGKRLAGLQFIAEDGSESPEWAHWGRSSGADYVVENIVFSGDRVGLKMFMGETKRAVTYEDTIIYALQALERLT